ncbi:MAG: hypothetical protein HFH87_12010 [Lachnospiraceae bacterium]|nr:hypothetical protein [Lachnospiraceae bacterium]
MEILEAYKILHEFHASLLGEKAFSIKHDAKEQKRPKPVVFSPILWYTCTSFDK